ncbi:hypothetical protein LINPERPRIM_LOCUS1920 [Linum perenne]
MATKQTLVPVKEAEALALLEALSWLGELGFEEVEIESDAKVVVDSLNRFDYDGTEFGDILNQCRNILDEHPGFEVVYGRRSRNLVAHTLARQAGNYDSPTCGESPLSWICNELNNVCLIAH